MSAPDVCNRSVNDVARGNVFRSVGRPGFVLCRVRPYYRWQRSGSLVEPLAVLVQRDFHADQRTKSMYPRTVGIAATELGRGVLIDGKGQVVR